MRGRFWHGVLFLGVAATIAGCPGMMKKGDDGGAAAGEGGGSTTTTQVDATTASATPDAVNASDIHRYPDENKLDNQAATIQAQVANVKTGAGTGDLISVLKKGTDTTRIADRSDFTLIVYKDPSNASKNLMGWVAKSAFTPLVWDAGKFIYCPKNQVAILIEGGIERCVTQCDSSNDLCPQGQACTGDAFLWTVNGIGGNVEFCNPGNKGNQPTNVDAGGTTAVDASVAQADAGVKQPTGCGWVMAPGITCPTTKGFKLTPNNECRMPCQKDADCKACSATAKCLKNTWCY
jgi:hypothetical protein